MWDFSSPTRNWTWALSSDWFAREYHPHHPKKQLLKDPNILTITATFLGFTPNPWAKISKLRVNILETNLPSLPSRTTAHYHRNRKHRVACASPFRKGSLPRLHDSFLSHLNLSEAGIASYSRGQPGGSHAEAVWQLPTDPSEKIKKALATKLMLNTVHLTCSTEQCSVDVI